MNKSKYLDSCISILKQMRGEQSNELESEQQRVFSAGIKKLKWLAKQERVSHEELYLVVSEVAEAIAKAL